MLDSQHELVTKFGYNAVNSKTSVTDPNGAVTTLDYDSLQRLKSTTTPSDADTVAGTTLFDYGANSGGNAFDSSAFKPTRITDARGYVTDVTYDALYRQVTKSAGGGKGGRRHFLTNLCQKLSPDPIADLSVMVSRAGFLIRRFLRRMVVNLGPLGIRKGTGMLTMGKEKDKGSICVVIR